VERKVLLGVSMALVIVLLFGYAAPSSLAPSGATIKLNPSVTYQTITGWEATAQAGQIECSLNPQTQKYDPAIYDRYAGTLLDQAAADGINRVRVEVKSGFENPVDYFGRFVAGEISLNDWMGHGYEIINDNGNPSVIDAAGFQFSELDHTMDKIVVPLRKRLQARGEQLYLNLNYVDFRDSTFEHKTAPQEYAEFVLASVQHIRSKYGFTPDAWEVILEPDTNARWSAAQIGAALAAAGDRLKAAGIRLDFIAPSTTSAANASAYFDEIARVPGALDYLTVLSYHRYTGVSTTALQDIADRAVRNGLDTAMLEHMGSSYVDLHEDLRLGRNSAWQQFTLAYCTNDNGAQYYVIGQADPTHPTVTQSASLKYLRQYFKFIRKGAVRIDAAPTSGTALDPLAFVNPGGFYTVVVKASAASSFAIEGLPAGRYGITYTTEARSNVGVPDVDVAAGGLLNTAIPAAGVITIYGHSGPPVVKPPPLRSTPGIKGSFLPVVELARSAAADAPTDATPAPADKGTP
jgi:hypothetical protein